MGVDAVTLASFEAAVQQKATGVFEKFLGIYRLPGNTVQAAELGAAVQRALEAAGGDAASPAFDATFSDELLRLVHAGWAAQSARIWRNRTSKSPMPASVMAPKAPALRSVSAIRTAIRWNSKARRLLDPH